MTRRTCRHEGVGYNGLHREYNEFSLEEKDRLGCEYSIGFPSKEK